MKLLRRHKSFNHIDRPSGAIQASTHRQLPHLTRSEKGASRGIQSEWPTGRTCAIRLLDLGFYLGKSVAQRLMMKLYFGYSSIQTTRSQYFDYDTCKIGCRCWHLWKGQ